MNCFTQIRYEWVNTSQAMIGGYRGHIVGLVHVGLNQQNHLEYRKI